MRRQLAAEDRHMGLLRRSQVGFQARIRAEEAGYFPLQIKDAATPRQALHGAIAWLAKGKETELVPGLGLRSRREPGEGAGLITEVEIFRDGQLQERIDGQEATRLVARFLDLNPAAYGVRRQFAVAARDEELAPADYLQHAVSSSPAIGNDLS